MSFKKVIAAAVCLMLMLMLVSCGDNASNNESTSEPAAQATNVPVTGELSQGSCRAVFTMSDGQTFTIECYPEYAPETVENFLSLVDSGFYDGLTFHRVIQDFVAQSGDPNGNGTGGSDKSIHGEFSNNGFSQNTLTHKRGSVAMARRVSTPDSASSQFYICYTDLPSLDGDYAVFGSVISGMEVIDSFLEIPTDENDMPETPIVIEKAELVK